MQSTRDLIIGKAISSLISRVKSKNSQLCHIIAAEVYLSEEKTECLINYAKDLQSLDAQKINITT